jgi:hypothetical protein
VNISNCGKVIIRKETDPDESPNATNFGYTKSFATDPVSENTFTLQDDGSKSYDVLLGSGYSVVEDVVGAGYDFDNVDCSASTGVSPTITDALVEFDIDSAQDILDCTYTNKARGGIVIEKVTNDGTGSFDFTSETLTPASWALETTAAGEAGLDSESFSDLAPGQYDASETVPAGWNLVSETCSDGSDPQAIALAGGETVTCRFVNARERGAILIQKTRKHATAGVGDHPHAGVDFTISGGDLQADIPATTGSDGTVCVDGLLLSSFAGDYVVTEDVPAGYVSDDAEKSVSVVAEGSCDPGAETAEVSFHNTPLTNVTISVDSQVDGGTASVINCGGEDVNTDADGDGSLTVSDLEPTDPDVTLTCTVIVDP